MGVTAKLPYVIVKYKTIYYVIIPGLGYTQRNGTWPAIISS